MTTRDQTVLARLVVRTMRKLQANDGGPVFGPIVRQVILDCGFTEVDAVDALAKVLQRAAPELEQP